MKELTTYQQMERAFAVFAKYDKSGLGEISVEHDIIYAGPNPSEVSEEDKAELESLCWHVDNQFECFYRFV